MANNILKEVYEKTAEYEAFYTGGDIQWTADGSQFLCLCNGALHIVDVNTCSAVLVIGKIEEDTEHDPIYTFQISHNNEKVISAHKSGLIKLWDRCSGSQQKVWRSSHKGPVVRLAFDSLDESVASGGSDGNIRLWDLLHNTCTSSLRGATGVFSVLKYHPINSKQLVFGAADDTKIRSWNSKTGQEMSVFSGHFSKITSIQFTLDGYFMVSSGRDRVLILWSLEESKAIRTLPVYESIEAMVLLPNTFKIPNFTKKLDTEGIYVACAGEEGVVKIWNMQMNRLMYKQTNSLVSSASEKGGLAVTHLLLNELRNMMSVVDSDHNIIIHDLETFNCVKQLVGFSDDILDLIFVGKEEKHIVVATNSQDMKFYDIDTMSCQIIKGHTDIVMSLAKFPSNPEMFVSAGKDNTVRIWMYQDNVIKCLGIGKRHTASVDAVCTYQTSNKHFVSVSQDNCIKIWDVPKDFENLEQVITPIHTEIAHQKPINSVAVAPNDNMIATASLDKTAKVWNEDLTLIGVLKGHKRCVICVKFSPVDQVVVTSSLDGTIKIWSIADLTCLKTFEGNDSNILKVEFLSRGQQIVSCGADGLLKLWNIKTSECKMSLDIHDGKIWSMAVNREESLIITAGSDSKLVKLCDVTLERKERMAKEKEEMILNEQELKNLLYDKKLVKALKLALRMGRPLSVLNIINDVLKSGNEKLYETIKEINHTQKETLLKFATEWNTNNKNCHAAQLVFNILAPEIISGKLKVPAIASFIESALPYSERHFERLTNLLQDLNIVTYTINCMQPHAINKI